MSNCLWNVTYFKPGTGRVLYTDIDYTKSVALIHAEKLIRDGKIAVEVTPANLPHEEDLPVEHPLRF